MTTRKLVYNWPPSSVITTTVALGPAPLGLTTWMETRYWVKGCSPPSVYWAPRMVIQLWQLVSYQPRGMRRHWERLSVFQVFCHNRDNDKGHLWAFTPHRWECVSYSELHHVDFRIFLSLNCVANQVGELFNFLICRGVYALFSLWSNKASCSCALFSELLFAMALFALSHILYKPGCLVPFLK